MLHNEQSQVRLVCTHCDIQAIGTSSPIAFQHLSMHPDVIKRGGVKLETPVSSYNKRLELAEMQRTLNLRSLQSENDQALEIATHYLRSQSLAMDLREVLRLRGDPILSRHQKDEMDKYIRHLVGEIKKQHQGDFGIKLEWPSEPQEVR